MTQLHHEAPVARSAGSAVAIGSDIRPTRPARTLCAMPALAALLALADQRLPSGGHVHSGGVEQAIADGLLADAADLRAFLQRRLRTAGRVSAGLAVAATALTAARVPELDAEADARTPSPASRAASRAQGRGLLRTARTAWAAPHAGLGWQQLGPRPHHPIVLGCAARAAGLDALATATAACYLSVTGPATAAQRLLALDPVQTAAVTLDLSDEIDALATEVAEQVAAAGAGPGGWRDLPDDGDPLLDLLAERHHARDLTLFAS
jgi:urease accessory protein